MNLNNFLYLFCISFLLLINPVYASELPGDWWGKVTIENMDSSNGAIISAYTNNTLLAETTVGLFKSDYYLIHVPAEINDKITFKINDQEIEHDNINWSAGDHNEFNLTLSFVFVDTIIYDDINLDSSTGQIILNINNYDLSIFPKKNITNGTIQLKKIELNPTGNTIDTFVDMNYFLFIDDTNISENMNHALLKIYYNQTKLSELNLDKNTLSVYYWNESYGAWDIVESTVSIQENYILANLTHFSLYGLFGQEIEPDPIIENDKTSSGGGSVPPSIVTDEINDTIVETDKTQDIDNISETLESYDLDDTDDFNNNKQHDNEKTETVDNYSPTGNLLINTSSVFGFIIIFILLIYGFKRFKK